MFNIFQSKEDKKIDIRNQVDLELRFAVLVLHRYRHNVTGMTMSAYTNPNPALWTEVA